MAVDKTEEAKKEAKEEEPSPKKGKLKLIIIIIAATLLVGGGAAAYFLYFKGDTTEEGEKEAPAGEEEEAKKEEAKKEEVKKEGEGEGEAESEDVDTIPIPEFEGGIIVSLDHFIVNIKDESGEIRYLKIEIKLELGNYEMQREVENKDPKIRDSIVTILTNKSVADVSDTKGKFKLKEEIRARINTFMTLGKVKEVYFTDFIIQ